MSLKNATEVGDVIRIINLTPSQIKQLEPNGNEYRMNEIRKYVGMSFFVVDIGSYQGFHISYVEMEGYNTIGHYERCKMAIYSDQYIICRETNTP